MIGQPRSEHTRLKISHTLMGHVGVVHTEETKQKIAKASRERIYGPDFSAKMSAILKGNKHALGCIRSPETRARMSAAQSLRFAKQRAAGRASR